MANEPGTTWALVRGGERLSLDAAAAVARACESPHRVWLTVDGGGEALVDDLGWLSESADRLAEPTDLAGQLENLSADDRVVFARDTAPALREAIDALNARGRPGPSLEPAAAVVGPDGAPLWRASAPSLAEVRDAGFEPSAVRAALSPPGAARAVYFDWGRLRLRNRETVREMDEEVRRRRLAEVLRPIGVEGDTAYLDLLWEGIRPRLDTIQSATQLLGYLASTWTAPSVPAGERESVRAAAAALSGRPPGSGAEAVATLDDLGGGRDGVPRRRRLVRWLLTGQEMAPALHAVWDHLGTDRALERIENARRRIST